MDPTSLWNGLAVPLIRIVFFISLGLFIANVIESLNWTHAVAKLAAPLVRTARLKDISGAGFSMAFFSGAAANSMLAEHYDQGKLSDRELVLSNLFNSLPTYFLHLPTVFFITLPFIGSAAVYYVGLTLSSAFLRTAFIVVLGRLTLPPLPEGCITCILSDQKTKSWKEALKVGYQRFMKRIKRILYFTLPIYALIYVLKQYDVFSMLQSFLSDNVGVFTFLPPEALGIVVFHIAAEFTAGLAAAGALLEAGELIIKDVVLALLLGNILSSPMRAIRHQLPYYAGIFRARTAVKLIVYNQTLRICSIICVTVPYFLFG